MNRVRGRRPTDIYSNTHIPPASVTLVGIIEDEGTVELVPRGLDELTGI